MVTTLHFDLDIDTTLGGNNASDYVIASQKAIKSYVDNTSSTVDQTYDSTSANAQSGVAIAGELSSYATQLWAQQQSGLLYSAMQQWVQNQGYTTNVGTVTSVNNTSPDNNGNVAITIPTVPTNISAFNNDSGYITSSALSNYVQATNGNTSYTNTGTETTMGYTDTSTYEMYGVIAGKNTTYGTGIILGAQNGGSGYMSTLTTSGLTLMNATNPPNIQTALLTVSNNNLAVNGSEVATQSDLSSLADTDLSNLSATGKTVIDGQWVEANESIISSNTSLSGSTALTKRITLPNDNHKYEVLIRGSIYTSSTSGKEVFLKVKGNENSYDRYIARCITRTSSAMYSSGTTLITASYVASNQTNLTIARESSWSGNCSELTVVAYRRIGTNT